MLATGPQAFTAAENACFLKLHRSEETGEVSMSGVGAKSGANAAKMPNGTPPAVYIGVAPFFTQKPGRGGPRLRRDRTSNAITERQLADLIAATSHADRIGLPFTRMITIHWEAAGVPLLEMAPATGRFIDLLTKALARHGSRTAWLFVHENKDAHFTGGHCHLLVHVPAHLVQSIGRLQRGWLRRITGQPYRKGTIHSRPIGWRLGTETSNPDLHAENLGSVLAYLVKGASGEAVTRFELKRVQSGGLVIGKRCGTSQNIGRGARAKGGGA